MMTLSRCNINDDAIDVNDANGDISSSRRTTHDLFSTEDSGRESIVFLWA